ncbi:MAG: hypothetical protein WC554_09435 [Clostridia bacterium]
MKKIISYSLWGTEKKYIQGALENIKNQKELFSDWKCRFYCHDHIDLKIINLLYKEGAEVVLKEEEPFVKHMDAPGMFWRFEILKDKDVERFIVRDCDGRLTQREKNCVKDWERSGKEFHIIRDHMMHGTKIMGGMWGATSAFSSRINYDDLLNQFNKMTYNNIYATDQEFLARMIYPLVKDSALVHDDWARFLDEKNVRKIPHLRINSEYIGMPVEIK